jgi:DNA-binding FadR family transcriptional regulator
MYPRSVRALQADALFVSALQRSDELNASQIWRAVAVALDADGGAGCAERVAQGFEGHLLADAAADPVLALLVRDLPGHLYELIVTVGSAADDIIAGSRRRLLALIRARDADGAGREMEQHLQGLSWTVERRCVWVREAAL